MFNLNLDIGGVVVVRIFYFMSERRIIWFEFKVYKEIRVNGEIIFVCININL